MLELFEPQLLRTNKHTTILRNVQNWKQIEYKHAILKVYDVPVFYFPKFFHPDPTVKRKSGFLVPVYGSSDNLGSWVNIPYYKVINEEKDITFNPRIYADDKFTLQSEYRQAFENSNLVNENKSSLPKENLNQDNSDLDDEIPF